MSKTLDDRRRALEDQFFAQENEKLLNAFRSEREKEARRSELARVTPFHEKETLDQLVEAGFGPETWLAVALIPLAAVAWADGSVAFAEREAILQAATDDGIVAGTPARNLLESWLETPPSRDVRDAWKAYIEGLSSVLGGAAHAALRDTTLQRARAVADAAGGFLGLGPRISKAEEAVLAELEAIF